MGRPRHNQVSNKLANLSRHREQTIPHVWPHSLLLGAIKEGQQFHHFRCKGYVWPLEQSPPSHPCNSNRGNVQNQENSRNATSFVFLVFRHRQVLCLEQARSDTRNNKNHSLLRRLQLCFSQQKKSLGKQDAVRVKRTTCSLSHQKQMRCAPPTFPASGYSLEPFPAQNTCCTTSCVYVCKRWTLRLFSLNL